MKAEEVIEIAFNNRDVKGHYDNIIKKIREAAVLGQTQTRIDLDVMYHKIINYHLRKEGFDVVICLNCDKIASIIVAWL